MDDTLLSISLARLALGFLPAIAVLVIMYRWALDVRSGVYANVRMLVQLLLIGYVLTFIFETEQPLVIVAVLAMMIGVSSWIALRPLDMPRRRLYTITLISIGASGLLVLGLVSQLILDMPRWFEPRYVVPLAGMVFANSMNSISLAAERFEAERANGADYVAARRTAMDAALIPQINALLAVGLVSLPGMMTGQILSGVDPLVAARYQILVMCMIFGATGLAVASYLTLRPKAN